MSEKKISQYILQSVSHALSILDLLSQNETMSTADVARSMQLGKATAFRLLYTLEHHGYISKNPDARYRLNMKLALLGDIVTRRSELAHLAHPYLEELRIEFRETVHMVGWNSAVEAVVLDRIIGDSPISYHTNVGFINHPAHIAASGQILLAFAEKTKLDDYFANVDWAESIPLTNPPIPDESCLRQILDRVRRDGFSYNDGNVIPGLYCFAVPIFDSAGYALAAMSISGPEMNLKNRQQDMVRSLRRAADKVQEKFSIGLKSK